MGAQAHDVAGAVDLLEDQPGQPREQNRSKITDARAVTLPDRYLSPERDTPGRPPLLRQSRSVDSPLAASAPTSLGISVW
jgi:hypothetical protein